MLVLVCFAVAGISGYRLFYEHSVDTVWGITVFLVSIGVLIWNVSLSQSSKLSYKRPSFKLFFVCCLCIFLVLAFAGVQPLAGYKDAVVDKVGSWVTDISTSMPEAVKENSYDYATKERGVLHLVLVGQWEGEGDKEVEFSGAGPFVVDYQAVSKTSLGSGFNLAVFERTEAVVVGWYWSISPGWSTSFRSSVVDTGPHYLIVDASGRFKLAVESYGCSWKVRVGRE